MIASDRLASMVEYALMEIMILLVTAAAPGMRDRTAKKVTLYIYSENFKNVKDLSSEKSDMLPTNLLTT